MKKIIVAVFCVLLAGSALMQSCKKESTSDPVVPIIPVTPIDSTKLPADPTEPPMPGTEPEIIQWAINKLPGKYLMTGGRWYFTDITIYEHTGPQTRVLATDTFGSHKNSENPNLSTKKVSLPYTDYRGANYFLEFYNFKILNDSNAFYRKIFVDIAGDSFIAAQCSEYSNKCKIQTPNNNGSRIHSIQNHNEDINNIKASDFWDVQQYNNVVVDSGKYGAFYNKNTGGGTASTDNGGYLYQVRYYYKKDSLILFQSDMTNNHYVNCGPNKYADQWQYKFGYSYGKKLK